KGEKGTLDFPCSKGYFKLGRWLRKLADKMVFFTQGALGKTSSDDTRALLYVDEEYRRARRSALGVRKTLPENWGRTQPPTPGDSSGYRPTTESTNADE